ncbi:uncharacterized protein Bfra_005505 [Botrytis fragariae]|uniref:Uncharacterized protein n=1 Tax=Botrytis fragariae TaxID=1964551 RepID=A0A8H6ARA5_9HELO|nr:uncharacterized protein Bfra_005505 [Botrytis fragariae]KAF5872151.1 hypothetical protein Bfra_005505 [Botrytis fragariae]
MTFQEYKSTPIDIPRKRKHHHQDHDGRSGQCNPRIFREDKEDHSAGFSKYRSIMYEGDTAVESRLKETSLGTETRRTNGERLGSVEFGGSLSLAKDILTSMDNEELDEGIMADTEDINESAWRKHQSRWCKNKHKLKVAKTIEVRPAVITDMETCG